MQSFQGVIARDSAKRVLVASRDPNTRQAAWGWASFVREGSLNPWVLEDGVLVSRATPERPGEVEFVLEPGFEDTILDVLHRIDDINIDGPIMDDEIRRLAGQSVLTFPRFSNSPYQFVDGEGQEKRGENRRGGASQSLHLRR